MCRILQHSFGSHDKSWIHFKVHRPWGTWVSHSVKHLTSAQVMILQFLCSSPALGYMLIAQRLEPASDSVSPFLSDPPLLTLRLCLCVCLSLSEINIKKIFLRQDSANLMVNTRHLEYSSIVFGPHTKSWIHFKVYRLWGTWVAQLVKHPILDFGSGHDPVTPE